MIKLIHWYFLRFQGSKVNYGQFEQQNSPLHLAAINGHIEVCKLLLKSGAMRSVTNYLDRTPAQMAADHGMYAICIQVYPTYKLADNTMFSYCNVFMFMLRPF